MQRRGPGIAGLRLRVLAAAALLCLGAALALEPLSGPSFTKYALFATATRPDTPSAPGGGPERSGPPDFLAPEATWADIVQEVGARFPEPGPDEPTLPPAHHPRELIDAVLAGRGICNDWAEALMILCADAGRACREWAHIPYPGGADTGHSVVDLWLPDQQRWAMLDAYLGFWARRPGAHPLSAPEFERALLEGSGEIEVRSLEGRRLRPRDIETYYRDPHSRLVEIVRNDPRALASHWTRRVERVNKPLGQLLQWASGRSPLYLVPDDADHRELRGHLRRVRTRVVGSVLAFGAAGLLILSALRQRLRS